MAFKLFHQVDPFPPIDITIKYQQRHGFEKDFEVVISTIDNSAINIKPGQN